jgi:osmotically-inducible protein OsmY
MKTDSQIQTDVIQALKWDPSVTHEHIGVAVSDGIVTLSGTIPSYIEKFAAEKAAQRVGGVKAVVEKMEVKLPGSLQRGDEDIAKAIVYQINWNVQLPRDVIKTRVEDGWVELSGEVEWDYQRRAAESCVRGVTGVKGVTNIITIKEKEIQPAVVKNKIEEALKRLAEREARRIAVEVRGSKVVLSGKVHSFTEMNDAKWAAWSAPGVTSVENNLRVGV